MSDNLASNFNNHIVQELKLKMAKYPEGVIHVMMQFNESLNIDFKTWSDVKMSRNTKMIDMTRNLTNANVADALLIMQDDEPKRYMPETKSWRMEVGSLKGKKFLGQRRTSYCDNAEYFVFAQVADGHIEIYKVNEWYNFKSIDRHNVVSAEEVDKEYNESADALHYFSLLKQKANVVEEKQEAKSFKITGDEEFMDTEDEDKTASEDDNKKEDKIASNKKSKKLKKSIDKKKHSKDIKEEAFEDSDDGDGEGREMDYGTSSSDDDGPTEMQTDIKSVAEESAQNGLLNSDEDTSENESDTEAKANPKTGKQTKNKSADKNATNANANEINSGSTNLEFPKKDNSIITEAEVRRYLMRKPITPTDLLLKFKNKRSHVSSEKLLESLTKIIKNLKPMQKIVQGKMYLSL